MLKTSIYLFLLMFLLYSCEYIERFTNKDPYKIDFTSVDEYPLFPSCDSLATISYRQQCFEETVAKLIQGDLEIHEFSSPVHVTDAIIVHFEIDKEGKANLIELETSDLVRITLPELEDVIRESLVNFPVLQPAKKRDFNVGSKYMIPIYIID